MDPCDYLSLMPVKKLAKYIRSPIFKKWLILLRKTKPNILMIWINDLVWYKSMRPKFLDIVIELFKFISVQNI